MPIRGGRPGGGSRGGISSVGSRTPRTSSTGSGSFRGFRIPFGSRSPRASSTPDPVNSNPSGYRSIMGPRSYGLPTLSDRWIAIIIGIIALGVCACVAGSVILPALGIGR